MKNDHEPKTLYDLLPAIDHTRAEPAGKDNDHRCGGDMTCRYGCGEWFCGMHLIVVPDNPPLCIPCYLDGVAARSRKLYAPAAPAAAA